jgi:chromatin remodeling complex protein RSC6
MAKKTSKKSTPKKSAKPRGGIAMEVTPSASLAAIVGAGALTRADLTKKVWLYIKKNGLQDSKNRRNINADDKLKAVFGGKTVVNMFEMTKLVNKHVK